MWRGIDKVRLVDSRPADRRTSDSGGEHRACPGQLESTPAVHLLHEVEASLAVGLTQTREVGRQVICMRADAIAGHFAVAYEVQRDIDHIILEPSPVQIPGCARVIVGQDVGQQDLGNR